MKNTEKKSPDSTAKITVPWIISVIASMVVFIVFIIMMYLNVRPFMWLGIWLSVLAVNLIIDAGIRMRQSRAFSIVYTIIGSAVLVTGLVVALMNIY